MSTHAKQNAVERWRSTARISNSIKIASRSNLLLHSTWDRYFRRIRPLLGRGVSSPVSWPVNTPGHSWVPLPGSDDVTPDDVTTDDVTPALSDAVTTDDVSDAPDSCNRQHNNIRSERKRSRAVARKPRHASCYLPLLRYNLFIAAWQNASSTVIG